MQFRIEKVLFNECKQMSHVINCNQSLHDASLCDWVSHLGTAPPPYPTIKVDSE